MSLPPGTLSGLKDVEQSLDHLADQLTSDATELEHLRALTDTMALVNSSLDLDHVLNEVMDTVMRDASYYRRTEGGMTLSGGEPLVQWRFALELLRAAKGAGLHTVVDTTGQADWEILDAVLGFTDLVLYDVKHVDSDRHREGTGMPNERILENLRKTVARGAVKVWVRYPLIPRFNDSEESLEGLCQLVLELDPPVEKVSLLPYHKFGELKYTATGKRYPWDGVPTISEERIEEFKKFVESHGIGVDVGR